MTAVDVDALDKLREAATAGPWVQSEHGDERYVVGDFTPDGRFCVDVARCSADIADAALIVAAVNNLPELLAEVRRGRALREAVEGLADLVEQGRAWTGDSLARRLRAVLTAADPS